MRGGRGAVGRAPPALQDVPAIAVSLDNYLARTEEQYTTAAAYTVALMKASRPAGRIRRAQPGTHGALMWGASPFPGPHLHAIHFLQPCRTM